MPYPPININVLPSQSIPCGFNISVPKVAHSLQALPSLKIPGPRDVAVKEYSGWQVSSFNTNTPNTACRGVCDVMLENGLDLGTSV